MKALNEHVPRKDSTVREIRREEMSALRRQVRHAYRRLLIQRFLAALGWCWFASLLAALGMAVVERFWPLGVGEVAWLAGGTGLGVASALIWTFATRRDMLDAAIEIDRRFALKERVSSTLGLNAAELETEAGRALLADAMRQLDRIHVDDQFRVTLARSSWLPLAPGLAVFAMAVFWNPAVEPPQAKAKSEVNAKKQIARSTDALRQRLAERRKQAEREALKEAENLFKKLEEGTREISKSEGADRKVALVRLNDLAKDLEKRRQALAGSDSLREQLNQLKNLAGGPADKLAKELRDGNFRKAAEELAQLKEQLASSKLDEKAKAELTRQLTEMQEKLEKMATAQRELQKSLESQIAQKRRSGQSKEADRLQEQLDEVMQKAPQIARLERMAQTLGECAQCMEKGQSADAVAKLEALGGELGELARQMEEMEMLEAAMDEIAMAKDTMNCKECAGEGCEACLGARGSLEGRGRGLGAGQGEGARPEERTDTGAYDSAVKQRQGQGAAIVTGLVDGPNAKGQAQQEIQTQFESVRTSGTDPLTDQRLPRSYRQHARSYFDALREGK